MGAARSRLELDGADLEERELVERRVDHRVGAAAIRLAREVMRTSPSAHPVWLAYDPMSMRRHARARVLQTIVLSGHMRSLTD